MAGKVCRCHQAADREVAVLHWHSSSIEQVAGGKGGPSSAKSRQHPAMDKEGVASVLGSLLSSHHRTAGRVAPGLEQNSHQQVPTHPSLRYHHQALCRVLVPLRVESKARHLLQAAGKVVARSGLGIRQKNCCLVTGKARTTSRHLPAITVEVMLCWGDHQLHSNTQGIHSYGSRYVLGSKISNYVFGRSHVMQGSR